MNTKKEILVKTVETQIESDNIKFKLVRIPNKEGSLITWQIIWGNYLIGIIRKYKDPYYFKRVGHRTVSNFYWIGSNNSKVVLAKSADDCIKRLYQGHQ